MIKVIIIYFFISKRGSYNKLNKVDKMANKYFSRIKEHWQEFNDVYRPITKAFSAIAILGVLYTAGANYLANTEFAQKIRERDAFASDISSRITEESVFEPIFNNGLKIDVEPDGEFDAFIGHIGARPGQAFITPLREH